MSPLKFLKKSQGSKFGNFSRDPYKLSCRQFQGQKSWKSEAFLRELLRAMSRTILILQEVIMLRPGTITYGKIALGIHCFINAKNTGI